MPLVIDSPANPRLKQLAKLRERKERDRLGLALVEGARESHRALAGGWPILQLLSCPALHSPEAKELAPELVQHSTEHWLLSRPAFEKLSSREHPDGLLAVVQPPRRSLAELRWPADALLLVADGLEKPGNLGALLRSADAAEADAVLVTGSGTDLANPQVIRASMGSLFAMQAVACDAKELRQRLKADGVRLVAATPSADTLLWDADLRGPVALVLGTEHEGLDPAWLEAADLQLRVPMGGMADSLNVATTGALLLFEARRQRRDA